MDTSYLKGLLDCGKEVRFYYGAYSYILKKVQMHSLMEYTFGRELGQKVTTSYFDDILYRRYYGQNLVEMLKELKSSDIIVC